MSALRLCAAVATLAFAVNAVFAHASPPKGGYYIGDVPRKCTADGDRCAGAYKKPYVKYAPCCDETKKCLEDEEHGWGRFCIDPPKKYGKKCYKTGVRCMGEKNKPYVEYMPCCSEKDECVKAADDWGSFCAPVEKDHKYVSKPKVVKKKVEKKVVSDYKSDYGKKYDSYYKDDYKHDDYYGYGGHGKVGKGMHGIGGKGNVKDFAKEFNLFPPKPKTPVVVVTPPAPGAPLVTNVNPGIVALLGLPEDLGCAAIPPAAPAAVDVVPVNVDPNRGDVFVDGPIVLCNSPGRGFSLAAARALLNAVCTRLRTIDPTVECYIQQIRGPAVVRTAVSEAESMVAERQVVVGVATVRRVFFRCVFRGGRLFLERFILVIRIIFIQFPAITFGILPTLTQSPGA